MSSSDTPHGADASSSGSPNVDFLLPLEESPAAAPPVMSDGAPAPEGLRLRFTGVGSEYFKIWAVNLALTILTLGIFSAWAKVRRLRYFYANTSVAGSSFDFHGAPAAILRGRLIALAVALAYSYSPRISPLLYAVVALLILLVFPWLYWRSLRFRLGNTSYRGARFSFRGKLSSAYAILLPPATLFLGVNVMLAVFAPQQVGRPPDIEFFAKLGLVYMLAIAVWPYYYHRLRAYQHGNAFFGSTPFFYSGKAGSFYWLAFKMILLSMVLGVVGAILGGAGGFIVGRLSSSSQAPLFVGIGSAILLYLMLGLLIPYVGSRVQNIVWNNTRLGDGPVTSALRYRSLLAVELVNFFATILTIGLFRPFAAVRAARVRLESMAFHGDPAKFEVVGVETGGPAGAELGEMIGFDIAL